MRRALAALALLAALCPASPARGFVLFEDPLEEESLEVGVLARTFAFLLAGSALRPPYALTDADPSGLSILDLRVSLEYRSSWLKVVVHNQLTGTVRSHAGGGGPLSLGRGLEPRRWVPLEADLVDEDTVGLRNAVDWLYAAVSLGPVTITAGRQPVSFGRGKLWQPTDLVAAFSLTEVDTEFKPGADAVRVDWTIADDSQLTAVAAAGQGVREQTLTLPGGPTLVTGHEDDGLSPGGSAFLLRYQQGWSSGEAGVLAGYVRGDAVLGLDAAYDAGGFDLYAEVTVSFLTDRSPGRRGPAEKAPPTAIARAVAGGTFKPHGKVTLIPELYYSGFGTLDPTEYLDVALSARVAVGEIYNLGQVYAGFTCLWEAHPLLNLNLLGIINPRDPSGLLSLGASYNLSANVDLLAGMYLPMGRAPDVSGVPADGVPNPLTGQLPVPRSEFGMYPYFFFLELKAAM